MFSSEKRQLIKNTLFSTSLAALAGYYYKSAGLDLNRQKQCREIYRSSSVTSINCQMNYANEAKSNKLISTLLLTIASLDSLLIDGKMTRRDFFRKSIVFGTGAVAPNILIDESTFPAPPIPEYHFGEPVPQVPTVTPTPGPRVNPPDINFFPTPTSTPRPLPNQGIV